ncbi:MAG: transketolase [Candidatus Lokiarchaeota archaeon]|nr:transketolase [Candidatus Lokiarchaeota archaeon]
MSVSDQQEKELTKEILKIKKDILKMIYKAQSGHPGGSLSCASLLYLLYTQILKIDHQNPNWEERDIFILSKGHAAPALYAVLSEIGYINRKDLFTLREFGSTLQGHPVKNKDIGIEVSTGSLGMGLSIGLGCALAAKLDQADRRIYVLLGDGELNEGAIWEAAMAASHFKLDNLTAIVDRNGIQIDGSTEEIMALEPLAEKWRAFGWHTFEVDGANFKALKNSFENAKKIIQRPSVIISYLTKGSDVSFMEHTRKYHGRPPNKEEYKGAIEEIETLIKKLNEEI